VALSFDPRNYVVELIGGAGAPVYVVVVEGVERARFPTRAAAEDAFPRLRSDAPRRP
jgi:hypothetical protein